MMKIVFLPLLLLIPYSSAQSPAAAPALAGPTNVTAILEKAGQFTTFIRLLESTKVADQINTQLNNSNQGLTIFAPADNAFSSLRPGMLNSFSDQQKVELIQFHILPNALSTSQFLTASNPLRTQAGGSEGSFSLNVTTSSGNQVNITTGVTNATVANTVYTDAQLAVYQVDQVLLPLSFFVTPSPAPAPEKPKKAAGRSADGGVPADSSSAAMICLSNLALAVKAMVCVVIVQAIFV